MKRSPSTVTQTSKLDNWHEFVQRAGALLPGRCRLCLGRVEGASLCRGCFADLPWWGSRLLPVPRYCARAVAGFVYLDPVNTLIAQAKYRRDTGGCRVLGELLAHRAAEERELPQVFVPVPMPWSRLLWRGQNHAQTIADALGVRVGVAVDSRLLGRRGWQRPQQGLSRAARLQNLRAAFTADADVRGAHIGIVDDVLTTGATLQSAARALRAAGARRVDVYVVAVGLDPV